MVRQILLVLIGGLIFTHLSCAVGVSGLPENKIPQVEKESIQKSAGDSGWFEQSNGLRNAEELEWQKILTAAKKEGKVTLYISGGSATIKAMVEAVKKKLGINMEYVIGPGAQMAAKTMAERAAGLYLYDVFIAGQMSFIALDSVGALDPLPPALILPEVKDPGKWWGGGLSFADDRKITLTFVGSVKPAFLYNTELVRKEELSSYWNLLEPKWKGKIVLYDSTLGAGNTSYFPAVVKLVGLDYFKKLVEQEPILINNNRLIVEWVAKGKYLLAMGGSSEVMTEFKNAGAPLDQLIPKEGTYITSSGGIAGLINKAPHPNAAKVFINFLLSKEGQDIWAVNEGVQSLRLDATTEHLGGESLRRPGINLIPEKEINEVRTQYVQIAREVFAPLMKAR